MCEMTKLLVSFFLPLAYTSQTSGMCLERSEDLQNHRRQNHGKALQPIHFSDLQHSADRFDWGEAALESLAVRRAQGARILVAGRFR
jgi:hypothetical protein